MVFKLSAEVFLDLLINNYSYLPCDATTDSDEFLNPLSTWLQCKTLRNYMKETLSVILLYLLELYNLPHKFWTPPSVRYLVYKAKNNALYCT